MNAPQSPTEVPAHTVTVRVTRGHRLRGRCAEFKSFVRVEVDEFALGESEKKVRDPSDDRFNYDFSCSFSCSRDAQAIAALAAKLLIVTVFDFVAEEKKADARSAVLGQAVLDFLPFLQGQTNFSSRVPLHSASMDSSNTTAGSLDLVLDVSEAVVSAEALSSCRLLKVTVERLFSVPESWGLSSGACAHTYTAAMELPLTAQTNQKLVFSEGVLSAAGAREEEHRHKKRAFVPLLLPANTVVPGAFIGTDSMETQDQEDQCFRVEAETVKPRVSWDVEMPCFLNQEATVRLRETITSCGLWPLEIMKSLPEASLPWTESPQIPCHGVAFVDLSPLLRPGATRIRGAYSVETFSQNLLSEKAQRSVSVLKEHVRALTAAVARKKGTGGQSSAKKPTHSRNNGANDGSEVRHEQENSYVEARTYVVVEISLEKPLVPINFLDELPRRLMALIPPTPRVPKGPSKAERALQKYHGLVGDAISQACGWAEELYGAQCAFSDGEREHMKAEVKRELQTSNRYVTDTEELKHNVVRIVLEKMQKTELFSTPLEILQFVGDLNLDSMDEAQVALAKEVFAEEQGDTTEEFPLSVAQVTEFATEAQSVGDSERALQCCLQLLTREPSNPGHTFLLGSLYMQSRDYMKAEVCFQDVIVSQPAHQASLIMCGVLAFMFEQFSRAQSLWERAASEGGLALEAWTLLSLLHQNQEDVVQSHRAFTKASELRVRDQHRGSEEQNVQSRPSVYSQTTSFLLQNYALQLAERALAQELLTSGHTESFLVPLGHFHLLREEYSSALDSLEGALQLNQQNAMAWALKGHCCFLQGCLGSAQDSYERCLSLRPPPHEAHLVQLRLGSVYQQQDQFASAKQVLLQTCEEAPSCLSWRGLGAACYRLGELAPAEAALMEANRLDHQNALVWLYLALVCLQVGSSHAKVDCSEPHQLQLLLFKGT
uniref:Uncharacterized protein n=1 Tax=Knipowitschia caucasica TaxID=637954 RepID=A0AAV2LUN9_KNICA